MVQAGCGLRQRQLFALPQRSDCRQRRSQGERRQRKQHHSRHRRRRSDGGRNPSLHRRHGRSPAPPRHCKRGLGGGRLRDADERVVPFRRNGRDGRRLHQADRRIRGSRHRRGLPPVFRQGHFARRRGGLLHTALQVLEGFRVGARRLDLLRDGRRRGFDGQPFRGRTGYSHRLPRRLQGVERPCDAGGLGRRHGDLHDKRRRRRGRIGRRVRTPARRIRPHLHDHGTRRLAIRVHTADGRDGGRGACRRRRRRGRLVPRRRRRRRRPRP